MKYVSCFLLILLSSVPLGAADFTVFAGFNHPGGITLGQTATAMSADTGQALTDTKDFGVFGVRLYRSNAPVGLEHTLAFGRKFLDSRANALIYNTNLRAQLPAATVQPYVTAGFGFVRAGGSGPASFGTKFSINYGAGVSTRLIGPLGIRLDLRGYSIRGVEDQTLSLLEATAGLVFAF